MFKASVDFPLERCERKGEKLPGEAQETLTESEEGSNGQEAGQEEPAALLENEGPDVPADSDGQSTE